MYMYMCGRVICCAGHDHGPPAFFFFGQNYNLCYMAKGALWVHVMVTVLGKQRCAMSAERCSLT